MKIPVTITETMLPGDYREIQGITATCSRCDHTTESFGTSEGSIRRCLAFMREECPNEESHFYVQDE